MEQSNNTQLPAEVVAEIETKAEHYANVQWTERAKHIDNRQSERWDSSKNDYEAGATEYATKLHTLQVEFNNIRKANERWEEAFNMAQSGYDAAYNDLVNLKEQFDHEMQKNYETISAERAALNDSKALLEEVRTKHEAGLLPDRFIYDKIKKFLYGE